MTFNNVVVVLNVMLATGPGDASNLAGVSFPRLTGDTRQTSLLLALTYSGNLPEQPSRVLYKADGVSVCNGPSDGQISII
jgi:phage protein U